MPNIEKKRYKYIAKLIEIYVKLNINFTALYSWKLPRTHKTSKELEKHKSDINFLQFRF